MTDEEAYEAGALIGFGQGWDAASEALIAWLHVNGVLDSDLRVMLVRGKLAELRRQFVG